MATGSKVIALLSACLSLATSGAVAALAIERDRMAASAVDTEEPCRPGACTIVLKTGSGGPPSVVRNVPVPASVVRSAPVLVAAAETAR